MYIRHFVTNNRHSLPLNLSFKERYSSICCVDYNYNPTLAVEMYSNLLILRLRRLVFTKNVAKKPVCACYLLELVNDEIPSTTSLIYGGGGLI